MSRYATSVATLLTKTIWDEFGVIERNVLVSANLYLDTWLVRWRGKVIKVIGQDSESFALWVFSCGGRKKEQEKERKILFLRTRRKENRKVWTEHC